MDTELRIQQSAFVWHWNTYPNYRGLFFKIKNEGTNRITGARDKATGLVPGVADSVLLVPFGRPVFIEFKTETGRQSQKQKAWQSTVESYGYSYEICRDLETFKNICREKLT